MGIINSRRRKGLPAIKPLEGLWANPTDGRGPEQVWGGNSGSAKNDQRGLVQLAFPVTCRHNQGTNLLALMIPSPPPLYLQGDLRAERLRSCGGACVQGLARYFRSDLSLFYEGTSEMWGLIQTSLGNASSLGPDAGLPG